jgi:hypothetical protein
MKAMKLLTALLFATGILFFAGCKKYSNSVINATSNPQIFATVTDAEDQAESIFNNVADNVLGVNGDAGLGTGIGVFTSPSCYIVTINPVDSGVFPKTVTIDFGTGCLGADNHVRMGQIITTYSGPLSKAGSTATTTFNNYFVDSVSVQGTHTITNTSTTDTLILTTTVQNGFLIPANADTIVWNRNKVWKQIAGLNTPSLLDDIFSVTGTSSGTIAVNDSVYNDSTLLYTPHFVTQQWSTLITQPSLREFTCQWIVEGETEITLNNLQALLNYGQGNCDNQALLTFNAYHFEITLP